MAPHSVLHEERLFLHPSDTAPDSAIAISVVILTIVYQKLESRLPEFVYTIWLLIEPHTWVDYHNSLSLHSLRQFNKIPSHVYVVSSCIATSYLIGILHILASLSVGVSPSLYKNLMPC